MAYLGGCLCGDVRFRVDGAPRLVGYCHCASCRRHTGAPVAAYADVARSAVTFTKGAPALYESSPGVQRGFCGRCGATLSWAADAKDEISLHIGAFDDPAALVPTSATFPEERLPWLSLP